MSLGWQQSIVTIIVNRLVINKNIALTIELNRLNRDDILLLSIKGNISAIYIKSISIFNQSITVFIELLPT